MKKYTVNYDVTPDECPWLHETVEKGTIVYKFYGATYGCIGSGIAVTLSKEGDNPFFEMPYLAVRIDPIRICRAKGVFHP